MNRTLEEIKHALSIGFEIEGIIQRFEYSSLLNNPIICNYGFISGDGSIKISPRRNKSNSSKYLVGYEDMEFISHILKYKNAFEVFNKISSLLKEKKCMVNNSCGLHIHFSLPKGFISENDFVALINILSDIYSAKYSSSIHKTRLSYCNGMRGHRYKACRVVDAFDFHAEIRVFNGSLNPRWFKHALESIPKNIENILNK